MAANKAKGEIAVTIGGVDLVLAVTPDGLARFDATMAAGTFHEIYRLLSGGGPVAVREALKCFVVDGDGENAWNNLKPHEFMVFGNAMLEALTAHMPKDDPGNVGGEGENPEPSPKT